MKTYTFGMCSNLEKTKGLNNLKHSGQFFKVKIMNIYKRLRESSESRIKLVNQVNLMNQRS